jgi:hypothetical protein
MNGWIDGWIGSMDEWMVGWTVKLASGNQQILQATALHFLEMCLSIKISKNHLLNIVFLKNWMPSNAIET